MQLQKWGKITLVALAVIGIALAATTLAVLTSNQTVPLNGSITTVNLGVYSDSGCTQNCTTLNAGTLNPGATFQQTVYVKNTGAVPETLTMAVNNWNPASASSYLTLTWNQQNTVLPAGQSVSATLTLTVAANCGSLTSFSCSVTITGTQ